MEIPATAWIGLGTVIAALIAALISYINMVVSKDQKISELRQKWIDDLRTDISDFIAHLNRIATKTNYVYESSSESEFIKKNEDDMMEVDRLIHKIRLKLNPKEHTELLKKVDFFEEIFMDRDWFLNYREAALPKFKSLEQETQKILKEEWERVKLGEQSFSSVRTYLIRITSIVAVIGILIIILPFFIE